MIFEMHRGVAEIRLDRPQLGNALSAAEVSAMREALAQAAADAQVHTITFTGAGRNFCTGFDLSDLDACSDATLLARFVQLELLLDEVWNAPMRTVAVAHGRTWGAGADLFTACDQRLARLDTDLRFPGAGFGLVLGTRRLAQRVGRDCARQLTCEGIAMDAAQAQRAGLVTAVVEEGSDGGRSDGPPPVARATVAALRRATGDGGSDADLAALVRSAAVPGLKQRISDYRARSLAASGK